MKASKLVLGIMCRMGAISAFADGTEGGFECLVAGALLLARWYLPSRKASKNAVEVVNNETAAPMQYVIVVPCAAPALQTQPLKVISAQKQFNLDDKRKEFEK